MSNVLNYVKGEMMLHDALLITVIIDEAEDVPMDGEVLEPVPGGYIIRLNGTDATAVQNVEAFRKHANTLCDKLIAEFSGDSHVES